MLWRMLSGMSGLSLLDASSIFTVVTNVLCGAERYDHLRVRNTGKVTLGGRTLTGKEP